MTVGKIHAFIRACAAASCVAMLCVAAIPAHAQAPSRPEPFPDKLLDRADVRTGWASHATLSVDATIKVHGTGSLKSVGSGRDRFRKSFATPMDVSAMRYLTFWYYVDRPDLLGSGTDHGQIELTSSGTFDNEEQNWSVRDLHLQRGWNYVVLDLPGRPRSGTPPTDLTRVNFFRIYHQPTASVTTRIDQITFTNREPASSAYSAYLDLKRISRSTTDVVQYDANWGFIRATQAGSAARLKACRTMRLDLTHREISALSLQKIGVTAAATDADLRYRRFLKEFMCGERVMSQAEVQSHLRDRAASDIAVTAQVAALFDLSMEAAAETQDRIADLDIQRIYTACGTNNVEVANYIDTGALPAGTFPGMNLLVKQCAGDVNNIALRLGTFEPPIVDRRAEYGRCMSAFTSQASQCDNPYAGNPDGNYNRALDKMTMTDSDKRTYKERMAEKLTEIRELTVAAARDWTQEATHARPNAPAADRPALETAHEQYDQARGRWLAADSAETVARYDGNHPPNHVVGDTTSGAWPPGMPRNSETTWRQLHAADAARFRAEKEEQLKQMLDKLRVICTKDPEDPQCQTADDELIPDPPGITVTSEGSQRCASMNLGDGQNAWFNRAPDETGFGGQISEADRIDHCLCKLFDRGYGQALPGDIVQIQSGCPKPEERVAQECLANPYDGIDGIKTACKHLMQPISSDRDGLGARICQKIMPNCDAPYMKPDGDCGCGTRTPDGGGTLLPGCPTGIPNCLDGIPAATGCGCQPFPTGANSCTKGGKDFYLALDPVNDLLVRTYPSKTYAAEHILVTKSGGVRFATPGVRRNQLFNANTLSLRAVLPGAVYDGTGQIKVSCTNLSTGARNVLIETIPLANLSTTGVNTIPVNLSASERNTCYGANANNKVYFEVFVDSKPTQPVGFLDILGDLGDIKPPCIDFPPRPTPGPRPLNAWPAEWTFSSGVRIAPLFNGTGPIPPLLPDPAPIPVCVIEGIPRPCP